MSLPMPPIFSRQMLLIDMMRNRRLITLKPLTERTLHHRHPRRRSSCGRRLIHPKIRHEIRQTPRRRPIEILIIPHILIPTRELTSTTTHPRPWTRHTTTIPHSLHPPNQTTPQPHLDSPRVVTPREDVLNDACRLFSRGLVVFQDDEDGGAGDDLGYRGHCAGCLLGCSWGSSGVARGAATAAGVSSRGSGLAISRAVHFSGCGRG